MRGIETGASVNDMWRKDMFESRLLHQVRPHRHLVELNVQIVAVTSEKASSAFGGFTCSNRGCNIRQGVSDMRWFHTFNSSLQQQERHHRQVVDSLLQIPVPTPHKTSP